MYGVKRRYYSRMWMNFMRAFSIDRSLCQYDDEGNCIGFLFTESFESVNSRFRSLRLLSSSSTEPKQNVLLFGVTRIRIVDFGTTCAVSEE